MTAIFRTACTLLAAIALCSAPKHAAADLIVDLLDASITPDGFLTVDVLLSGDGVVEQMSDYDLRLNITPITATAGTRLEYIDPQSEAFLTNPNYVFFGVSDAVDAMAPATVITTTFDTNDSFQASDLELNFNTVPIDTDELLVQVDYRHVLGGANAAATDGDTFQISLDPTSSFLDGAGDEIMFNDEQAMITVSAATAIPEPSTTIAGLVVLAIAVPVVRRRRRRKAAA